MPPEELTFFKLQEPAPRINIYGTKRWYNEKGQLHRDNDLPAVIYLDGARFWFKNGEPHRDNDLPAIIWSDGCEEYFENGKPIYK